MAQDELLACMREAADALTELAEASPDGADEQVREARRHFDLAVWILTGEKPRFPRLAE